MGVTAKGPTHSKEKIAPKGDLSGQGQRKRKTKDSTERRSFGAGKRKKERERGVEQFLLNASKKGKKKGSLYNIGPPSGGPWECSEWTPHSNI
jgi:hypothetical protein